MITEIIDPIAKLNPDVEGFLLRIPNAERLAYRRLLYYAAMPLVVTPELLHYLRNTFVREAPWVAEADLLLADHLFEEKNFEQYVMQTSVRDYLLREARESLGEQNIQEAARLLVRYLYHQQAQSGLLQHEFNAQTWAALLYLDEYHDKVVAEIVQTMQSALEATDATGGYAGRAMVESLIEVINQIAPTLANNPELIDFALLMQSILHEEIDLSILPMNKLKQPVEILGARLPSLSQIIKIKQLRTIILPDELQSEQENSLVEQLNEELIPLPDAMVTNMADRESDVPLPELHNSVVEPIDKLFDPSKFIDREFEQEIFEQFLQMNDNARILTIQDIGGMGKTYLLRRFQYRCRTAGRPRIPVALLDLGGLEDSSPLVFVQLIVRELTLYSVEFPNYSRLEMARRAFDFASIRDAIDSRHKVMNKVEEFSHGFIEIDAIESATTPMQLSVEQQDLAQQVCIEAFLDELKVCCQKRRIVLLLDSYEKCSPDLKSWLLDHLLEPLCFDLSNRPQYLLIVIAGRVVPPFEQHWTSEEIIATVMSINSLGKWSSKHVEELLRMSRFNYTERESKLFADMIDRGMPPSLVIQTMESLLSRK